MVLLLVHSLLIGDTMRNRENFTSLHGDRVPAAVRASYDAEQEKGEGSREGILPRHVPIYLPEIHPIPDAQEFNPSGSVATGAVGLLEIPLAPAITNALVQLPPGNIGIIRSFTIGITNMVTTTNVAYSLLINGAPAGGYGALVMTPRAGPYIGNSFDCFIRVPNNAKISVFINNIDGGAYVASASLSGWYWPEASGKRWLAGGF